MKSRLKKLSGIEVLIVIGVSLVLYRTCRNSLCPEDMKQLNIVVDDGVRFYQYVQLVVMISPSSVTGKPAFHGPVRVPHGSTKGHPLLVAVHSNIDPGILKIGFWKRLVQDGLETLFHPFLTVIVCIDLKYPFLNGLRDHSPTCSESAKIGRYCSLICSMTWGRYLRVEMVFHPLPALLGGSGRTQESG